MTLERFLYLVTREYARAVLKFPTTDCAGLALMEEAGEVAKALLDEPSDRVEDECVQVAVMAARIAISGDPSAAEYRANSVHQPGPHPA